MTDHSVLLLAYGQSNADAYPAMPALPCEAFGDPRIVTFNDGQSFRGLLGAVSATPVTELVPALIASDATKKTRNYQSFQLAAAARLLAARGGAAPGSVIIRGEARGGRKFHGYVAKDGRVVEGILTNVDGSESQILLNLFAAMQVSVDLARRQGRPVSRVFINFLHGESERSASRDDYRAAMELMIDAVEAKAATFGLPVDWLILEPAGTGNGGNGNEWPCRLAMRDVADARANVYLIGTGYAYQLDDVIHYGSAARALFGEHFGAAAAHLLARDAGAESGLGWLLEAPRPPRARLNGTVIDLELDSTEAFELVPGLSDPHLTVEGFAASITARCTVVAAVQTGPRSVRVALDRVPATADRAALNYAYRIVRRQDARGGGPMPAGRGGWRSVKALDSMVLPGRRIHQWVPGFSLPFAAMAQG